ncbi:hypothetical protein PRUPE_2G052400 [Prunus persica]|uniref:Uncharacterized protein n=1 Tax=Prunus persica TaxID=3760 RepID=A0A251QEV3_PRUPE|nr:hypothetical protein PRUPE_2G052400 [Prunus persica]
MDPITKLPDVSKIDTFNELSLNAGKYECNKICRHTIVCTLSNELFYIYCSYKTAKEIWENLNKKYVIEDASTQKYAIGNFLQFQMVESKDVSLQIHEYHKLVNKLKNEDVDLPETLVCGSLIEKLPELWKECRTT